MRILLFLIYFVLIHSISIENEQNSKLEEGELVSSSTSNSSNDSISNSSMNNSSRNDDNNDENNDDDNDGGLNLGTRIGIAVGVVSGVVIFMVVLGVCAKHQRELTTAIKRARVMALLPYRTI